MMLKFAQEYDLSEANLAKNIGPFSRRIARLCIGIDGVEVAREPLQQGIRPAKRAR
jgi:hypothetical protein